MFVLQRLTELGTDKLISELTYSDSFYDFSTKRKLDIGTPRAFYLADRLEHCVQRVSVCAVLSHVYLFAYCLNPNNTRHFTRFRHLSLNVALVNQYLLAK